MNNLLILGAGQFGLMVKEIAESMGCFDKIDFLDDNNEIAVGKLCDYEEFAFGSDIVYNCETKKKKRTKTGYDFCDF